MIGAEAITPVVAEAALGEEQLDVPRQSGRGSRVKAVAKQAPVAAAQPSVPPTDAWLSVADFQNEVVPDPIKPVVFAGFAHSFRATKQHNYRREWRKLLNDWLAVEGFTERV